VIFPPFVYCLEELSFLRELLLDIFSIEDVFKVHPLSLESKPLIDDIRNVTEMFLPQFNCTSNLSDILITE